MQEDPTKDIAPQVQSLLAKFSDQLPGFDEAVDTDSSVQAPQNKVDRIYAEMFGGQPQQRQSATQPAGQPPATQREQQYFDLSGERQQLTREQRQLESEGRGVHFDQIRQISGRLKEIESEISELKPEGPGIRMINALNNFVSGAAEMPAGALKGVAALAKQADDLFGTDFQPGDVSDQATYKLGQKISDLAKKHFPTDPVLQEEFSQKLAAGLGSFLSFGIGGLGARAVTGSLRGGQVFAFGAAGLSGTGQQYDEAIQHGASEEDAQLAANWGFLPGVIQVSNTALRVLNRWDKAYAGALKEGIMRRVLESGKTGINEAIVETLGQAGYNKIAQEIYDAERPLIEGLGEAGSVGGSAGFLSDLLMSAFLGRTGGTRGTASPGGTDRPSPSLEKVRIELENGQDAPTPEELEAAQQAEADKRKPMGVGRYNDEDVTVLGQDNQGDLYIQHPDGRQEHIQKELLEDFVTTDELEVSNAILEGAQQQISNQSQAIQDPETGDVVTPDDPRFPQVQQSAQQAAEQVTQLTMGQGDKRRVANMRQQPGGQYRIDSVDGVPVEELTGTEVNSALNDLAKELEPRGNFEIEAFPVDPNDPMGAMEILVIPQQGSSLDGAETQTEQQGDDTAQPEIVASEQNMEAEIQPEAQETTETGVNQWKAGDTYTDSRGVSKKIERLGRDFDQDVEVFFDDGTRGLLPKTKQETSGTITEQKEAEEPTSIEAAIEAYEGDSNFTVMDLVNAVESMSDSDQLDQAVRAYREQQRIDTEELAGRNDMDAAEDAFIQALRQHIEQETTDLQTDEGQTQPVETSPEGLPESPETTEGGTQVETPKSSTQFNIEGEAGSQAVEFAQSIPEAELYDPPGETRFGREDEPHVTLFYGLTEHNPQAVQDLIAGAGDVEITLGKTSLFQNPDYDVLKVEVEGDKLRELHNRIKENLPNETTFPDYNPHMTIAYLKPGEGEKYVGDTRFEGQTMTLSELLHSDPDRNKTTIPLTQPQSTPELTEDQQAATQPEGETSEAFRMVPLSSIQTSVDRFQNRDAEYSQDTVDSIVDDHQAGRLNLDNIPPILVWRDPKDNQLYVVGGHSRLEAFRRLGRQNIQTQELTGLSEEQARQRGREDNALGTQESLVEQAKLVREWMGQDMSKAEMDRKARQLFKNNSRLVQAYAALSPSGKALQTLRALEGNQTGDRTRVQDFAKYVGEARLRHPQLTDSHETELFNYLLENDNARTQNQRNFLGFVDEIVSRNSFMGDFDASKPLNIRSVRPKSQLEQQQEQALKDAEKEFNDASKAFQNKVKEIEDRRKAGENISMEAANRTLENLQQQMLAAQRRVIQERQNTGQTKAAARSQTDIFGSEPQQTDAVEGAQQVQPESAAELEEFTENKVFSKDKAEDAFAKLREKLKTNADIINEPVKGYIDGRGKEIFIDPETGDSIGFTSEARNAQSWQQDLFGETRPASVQGRSIGEGVEKRYWQKELGFTPAKNFELYSNKSKIESVYDVANLFRKLENEAYEHAFALYIDAEGNAYPQHISSGGPTSTIVPIDPIVAGVERFKPTSVYFVHNHPSGYMKASSADINLIKRIQEVVGKDAEVHGIIMDVYKGEFLHFWKNGNLTSEINVREGVDEAEAIHEFPVQRFGKAAYNKDAEIIDDVISSSQDVAEFYTKFRYSVGDKLEILFTDNARTVSAAYAVPNISDAPAFSSFITKAAAKHSSGNVIIVGRKTESETDNKIFFTRVQEYLRTAGVSLDDVILVDTSENNFKNYQSLRDRNILREQGGEYTADQVNEIDPEIIQLGIQAGGYLVEGGNRDFNTWSQSMTEMAGDQIRPYLKSIYNSIRDYPGIDTDGMTPYAEVSGIDVNTTGQEAETSPESQQEITDIEETPEASDESTTAASLEPDSPRTTASEQVGEQDVQSEGTGDRPGDGEGSQATLTKELQQQGDPGLSDGAAAASRTKGDQSIYTDPGQPRTGTDASGDLFTRRSRQDSDSGIPADGRRSEGTDETPQTDGNQGKSGAQLTFEQKITQQKQAESVPYKAGDSDNIRESLPVLFPQQQNDVIKAETRFLQPSSYINPTTGMMFTNGTGTGKTYSGLGIAKRFDKAGKKNILIVVPTDHKAKDWIDDGKNLMLNIRQLDGIEDGGNPDEAVVTTYANFRQNESIADRDFDLVIYDESHKIMSSQGADRTAAYQQHKYVANAPSQLRQKATDKIVGPHPSKKFNRDELNRRLEDPSFRTKHEAEVEKFHERVEDNRARIDQLAEELYDSTKVVFLSATPFSYVFNLDYADGYLFQMDEGAADGYSGYNQPGPREQFFIENFGYKMRYNRLEKPDAEVDLSLMEREFHEKLQQTGALSKRILDLDYDYSRDFILVDDVLGSEIDRGLDVLSERKDGKELFPYLNKVVEKRFNWVRKNQTLESIKAQKSIPRLQQHLDAGRKIVVFHSYLSHDPVHIFDFSELKQALEDAQVEGRMREDSGIEIDSAMISSVGQKASGTGDMIGQILSEIERFESQYPDLVNLDMQGLKNPVDTILEAFEGKAAAFNGTIPKKQRFNSVQKFNKDDSGLDILVVQMEAGKEGISLHDTTGVKQRVMHNLGLPYKPTDAIQTEGRVYRVGQKSNAIFEYPVLHLNFEQSAFADKISERTKTAENLALGNKARNLELAFTEGYTLANNQVEMSNQGTGGKQADYTISNITPFDRAKTYYYARQKRNSKTKAREGKDYFATPEPLGMKMAQWLMLKPNQKALEPSAGHGAIARFFPEQTVNTFIEPSNALSAQLAMNANGTVKKEVFEDLHIVNKFDGIAMNPPFGSSGKTAMDHLKKAFDHLVDGGRMVAIIPEGPSMEKRFDAWQESDDATAAHLLMEIKLPSVTFERAGTKVVSRIVVIDKIENKAEGAEIPLQRQIDLSSETDINALFEMLEDLEAPPKTQVDRKKSVTKSETGNVVSDDGIIEIVESQHTRDGYDIWVGKMQRKVDYEIFKEIKKIASDNNGYYSSYNKGGAIPGFIFKTPEDAAGFVQQMNQHSQSGETARFSNTGGDPIAKSIRRNDSEHINAVREAVQQITDQWADSSFVTVVDSSAELPTGLQARFEVQGIEGSISGVYHAGQVYIVADNARSPQAAVKTLQHEVFGHLGLRRLAELQSYSREDYRGRLDQILTDVYSSFRSDPVMQAIKQEYNLDFRRGEDRLIAADEYLSRAAEGNISETLWDRIVKWVNDTLKALGFDRPAMTKADIKQIIRQSKQVVESGMTAVFRSDGTRVATNYMDTHAPLFSGMRGFGEFYSNAMTGLQYIDQPAATAEQWVKMIADKGGKGTSQELEWIGLQDFLTEFVQTNNVKSVPREVVEQYIRDNKIAIEQVELGGGRTYTAENYEQFPSEVTDVFERHDDDSSAIIKDLEDLGYEVEYGLDGVITSFRLAGESSNDPAKFSEYTLPGGENYREVLLTLPVKQTVTPRIDVEEVSNGFKVAEYSAQGNFVGYASDKTYKSRTEAQIFMEDYLKRHFDGKGVDVFRTSHFDQPNILAHVRLNDRTLENGEKLLFIEELQSDWAQAGRRHGFALPMADSKGRKALEERLEVIKKKQSGELENGEFENVSLEWYEELRAEKEAIKRRLSGVANMPYKKTDQWAGMAFRRVLAMAAEQGYDRIAWTTGEQQADRYDLSKQVDAIKWSNYKQDKFIGFEGLKGVSEQLLEIQVDNQTGIVKTADLGAPGEWTGKHISDIVGKELSDKILESNEGNLSGQDLKVGGEGMKGFYNKILPKVAGKEAQRFDKKARVEVIDLGSEAQVQVSEVSERFYIRDSEGQYFQSDSGESPRFVRSIDNADVFNNAEAANRVADRFKESRTSKQLSVKLSFDARKNLEEGIPLFKADAETRFRNTADLDEQAFPYKRRFDNWVRKFQDANIANKRLIEGVRAEGGIINDQNNFYQDAQLRRGRIENQLNKFRNGDLAEFTEVMQRGHNELGITHQDYYKYLQVRHAPDVNKRFKELNGLENASGYSQAEIDQWNAKFEEKGWTDFLENEVAPVHDRIVRHNLRMQVAYGLITPQRFAAMKRMYPNYTPMRGFEEFMDVDPTLYVRPERQEGRASKPGDSIAYLIGYTESTIIHGETNLVKEKAGKFAEQNWDRQDLLQIKNVYWRDTGKNDPETGKRIYLAETDRPSVEELMDGRVVRTIDPDQTMAKWTESGNPFTKSERTMRFMRRGKPMVIEFAAPHHATALSNTNIDRIPKTLNWLAKYMGFLRNAYITYSPEFPLRNAFRDGITGLLHVYTDFDTKTAAAIANPKRMSKMYSALWKAFKHENFDSEFGDSVKSFLYHGGKSGYYQLNQMKRLTKDLQEAIERDGSNWYKSKQAMKGFHDWLQAYTTSIENLIRLSGYDHFIKNGVVNPKTGKPYTEKQAASYFKDLTVNFDRKGEYGSVIGLGWIFYNATMQNIARLAEPFFSGDPRRMRRAATVPLIMGGVAYMMSDMLRIGLGVDDDDEYRFDKINDFTIAHRLMIPNFLTDNPGDMLSIPLPYGQNVYWAAGVYANKLSNNQLTTEEVAMNLASLAWQSYNPIGGEAVGAGIVHSGLKTFLPTVTIPPYELATNVDFRGLPIVPERFGREQMAPNYQNYRYYTREWAKKTAKAINTLSGGDEYTGGLVDVSPNTLEFLINSYLGGAGNFVFTTLDAATQAVNHLSGEDPITGQDLRRFPIARVYFSDVPRSANRNKFYDNVRELERFQWQYAQIADREGYQAAGAFAAENREKMQLIQLKNAAQSAIRQHFSYLNQLPGDDREKSEEILSRINEFYNEFNREYNRIEGKSASQNPPPRSLSRLLEPIAPPQ